MAAKRAHPAASTRTRVRRLPERGALRPRRDRRGPRRRARRAPRLRPRGQPFVIPTLHARVGDQVYVHGSAASRTLRELARRDPRLPHRHAARRDRARAVGVRALDELPLGGRARDGDGGDRARREARGARGVHREAPARALGRGAAADAEGAQGHLRAAPAARRGVREDPRRRPDDGDTPGRRARRLGRIPPARRAGARARCRPDAATRAFPCRPASGRTAGPGSSRG